MTAGSNANLNSPVNQRVEPILANAVILTAFALRVWALDAKGLAYDESATALMSRASVPEIVSFHWNAAFEHLPLWIILMRGWSSLAGQSEIALRYPSVLAGVLLIPLIWSLLKKMEPRDLPWRVVTVSLIVISPILLFYAQEARMYSLVVVLGFISAFLLLAFLGSPRWYLLPTFILVNWAMLGMQYYSILLLVALGLFTAAMLFIAPTASSGSPTKLIRCLFTLGALALSVLPLLLWTAYAPGFQDTLAAVLGASSTKHIPLLTFGIELWRDLSFGAIRWQPEFAWVGFLIIPIFLVGLISSFLNRAGSTPSSSSYYWWPLLFTLIVFIPVGFSAILFRSLAARYILYIVPFIYAFTAYGIVRLWRMNRAVGLFAGILVLAVSVSALVYYFGPYTKSEYRDMARYVQQRYRPDKDSVFIEGPRQHLMAKYYFGQDFPFQPIPDVELPDYWPLNAQRVVPEEVDDVVQQHLRDSETVWLMLSAESEVDPGEFLGKYLAAVAYKDDCKQWLDARLCIFTSPESVAYQIASDPNVVYGNELGLAQVHVALPMDASADLETPLRMKFDWRAEQKPSIDYTVAVKLMDEDGRVVAQADQYPIGPLLPPTTWMAGDEKPGYVVVEIPPELPSGIYTLIGNVYDPTTMESVVYSTQSGEDSNAPLVLGLVEIGDTMRLLNPDEQTNR